MSFAQSHFQSTETSINRPAVPAPGAHSWNYPPAAHQNHAPSMPCQCCCCVGTCLKPPQPPAVSSEMGPIVNKAASTSQAPTPAASVQQFDFSQRVFCPGCGADFGSYRSLVNHFAKSRVCPHALQRQYARKNSEPAITTSTTMAPKRFRCDYCKSTFFMPGNLRRHERLFHGVIHDNDISSSDDEGEATAEVDSGDMVMDAKSAGGRGRGGERFQCNKCPRNYATLAYLRNHRETIHNDDCTNGDFSFLGLRSSCNEQVKNGLQLVDSNNAEQKSEICRQPHCGKAFSSAQALSGHLRWCRNRVELPKKNC